MYKIVLFLAFSLFAWAGNLNIANGQIKAHTEVFGDSTIDPETKSIQGDLTIDTTVESIKGKIYFNTLSLVSDKKDRDENMYELLKADKIKTISFDITSITKNNEGYVISGNLNLNGISKNINVKSAITENKNLVTLNGAFSMKLTDFGLKPPTLLFLTVRDQIDITYNILLTKGM